jgi:phosphohistidine swiveling domain-containing protein
MNQVPFKHPDAIQDSDAIGGKASGLRHLQMAGLRVPPWVVLPADCAGVFIESGLDAFRDELRSLFDELDGGAGVAVRSSGLREDGRATSYAGQYETVFCREPGTLLDALETVLRSTRAGRVAVYDGASHAPGMAVILQQCIAPILSGVLFSANPASALPDQACVEAVRGAGGALVGGDARPSRFMLDRATGDVVESTAGADGPEVLNSALANELLAALRSAEEALNAAVDMEWATDESGLWPLQARPITRLTPDPALLPPFTATSWFFDQRFTEPISPLTRTSLLPLVLRMSVEEPLRLRGESIPDPLVWDYAGQVYIHLDAYQRLLRGVPRWLLTPDLRQIFPAGMQWNGPFPTLSLARSGVRLVWRERTQVFGNIRHWDRFAAGLSGQLSAIPNPPASDAEAWLAAWGQLDTLSASFLRIHRWSIVLADIAWNTFRVWTRWLPAPLRRRLYASVQDRVRLVTSEANTAWEEVRADDGAKAQTDFRERFGHRSDSLDYTTPTWAERFGARAECDTVAVDAPVMRGGPLTPLVRLLEMREAQRFHWERILARQRYMLLDAGRHLASQAILDSADDLWWLNWDELIGALQEGDAPEPAHLKNRQHAARLYQVARRPPHIGPVDTAVDVGRGDSDPMMGIGASEGTARGTAVVCRRMNELPDPLPPDTILVLPALDPGWTPVLKQVCGLVTERGGLLSHAAIIAREYGVPLVAGVADATERIAAGTSVEVDGQAGWVRLRTTGVSSDRPGAR